MSEASFTISSTLQKATVSVDLISGSHDALYAYLHIPINFSLSTPGSDVGFDILPVIYRLFQRSPAQLLSEASGPFGASMLARESKSGYVLKFSLTKETFNFIEASRNGDVQLTLELNIHALIKAAFKDTEGHRRFSPDRLNSETISIMFQIPRSVWVEKILPELGYRKLRLIEIPLIHDEMDEPYKDIIHEFNEAERYFNGQDYNKCVAHCRNTMDKLTQNLQLFKKEGKSGTGFKWLSAIGTETFNWLDTLNKKTSGLASKTHHPGQDIDFTQKEAQSIYLVVLGLLNYIGYLAG
jgi:hypothetical protein